MTALLTAGCSDIAADADAPVDVVVVAHRSADVIDACLASVVTDPAVGSVVVVDNASPDDSAVRARRWGASVVPSDNRGFGAGCNLGAWATAAPYVLFLNPDAAVAPGTVAGLRGHLASHPHTAAVASELRRPDGRPEPVARRRPTSWRAPLEPGLAARLDARALGRRAPAGGPVPWVSGAALLVRRSAFEAVGGFDESFFLYGEDADLALRLRREGWAVDHVPGLVATHVGGTATAALGPDAKVAWARGWVQLVERHHARPRLAVAAMRAGLRGRAIVWRVAGRPEAAARWRRAASAAGAARAERADRPGPSGVPTAGRRTLLGTPVDAVDLDEAEARVAHLVDRRRFGHVVTSNVDFLHQADGDASLLAAMWAADLVVADGVPLLWMASLQGTPLPGRVNGTDLTVRLLARAGADGWPVCIVGGEPGVAPAAADAAAQRFGVTIAGVRCPSRHELDDPDAGRALARWVAASGARLLLLGVGGGRQERWIARHRDELGDVVAIGVGSALDFVAGTRPRAPRWMQRHGLEWAWRLAHEPGRLWRRYLVDDLRVLARFALADLTGARR